MTNAKKSSTSKLEARISRQRQKLARIEEQLGYMMSRRALEEEKLANLLEQERQLQGES